MKRALFALIAAPALWGLTGCAHHRAANNEQLTGCYGGGCVAGPGGRDPARTVHHPADGAPGYNAGPPVGQVTYPYYTLRGPRDFLDRDPPSIGP